MNQSLTKTLPAAPDQVDCLLIPLKDKQLLLPNVSVAEIIPFSHLLTTASSVDWILGRIDWRGVTVPWWCATKCSTCQMLRPRPEPQCPLLPLLTVLGANKKMPFYALLIQGIPKGWYTSTKKDIQEVDAMHMGGYDARAVTLGQDPAMIPGPG